MKQTTYCTLYIVRHGETEWNVERRLQGQKDSPLTSMGIQQAERLRESLRDIHFDAVFSSDLLRAKRTAEIISLERDVAVKTSRLIREHDYNIYEGKKADEVKEELRETYALYEQMSDEEKFRYRLIPNGETDEELVSRFITFLREVSVAYKEKRVLVVSHGGIMASLLVHLGFAKQEKVKIANTGYFILKSDGIEFAVKEAVGIRHIK